MKIGTRMPPPVHAKTIETSLKEKQASFGADLNTLLPINIKQSKRHEKEFIIDNTDGRAGKESTHHA